MDFVKKHWFLFTFCGAIVAVYLLYRSAEDEVTTISDNVSGWLDILNSPLAMLAQLFT